jgi:hypothetical protein
VGLVKAPTMQLSRDLLVKTGWRVVGVEKWNPATGTKNDLFGMFDLLALREGVTMGVQTTSKTNLASHVKKMREAEALADVLAAGWTVMLHGWWQPGGPKTRWQVIEIDVGDQVLL